MISCCIVGATGLVGQMVIKVLEERNIMFDSVSFYASKRSAGKKIYFRKKEHIIEELTHEVPKKQFTYCIFTAGTDVSKEYAYEFINYGSIVIDNSSCYRMSTNVPLVVPEVNMDTAYGHRLIANPNCSTIQAAVVIKPLLEKYKIKRIVISTYQAASGGRAKRYR